MIDPVIVSKSDLDAVLSNADQQYFPHDVVCALQRLRACQPAVRVGVVQTGLGPSIEPRPDGQYLRFDASDD